MSDFVGVFDDRGDGSTSRVKYNEGAREDGVDSIIHAVVTHVVDDKNLILAAWKGGVFTLLNDGNPVPERDPSDYQGQSGGVTWHR